MENVDKTEITKKTIQDGIILGLVGYCSVALLYAVIDFLAARGFLFTVNLLGMVVFRGLRDPSVLSLPGMQLDMTAIYLFSALHLFLSLLIGFIVSILIEMSEINPAKARLILTVLVSGFFITVIGVGILTEEIRQLLPWWSIVVANALAVIISSFYLTKKHPGIWDRLGPFAG